MSNKDNYDLMDSSDYINKESLHTTYVAFDKKGKIIAVGIYEKANAKAISRGCNTPNLILLVSLKPRLVKEHNEKLEKILSGAKLSN